MVFFIFHYPFFHPRPTVSKKTRQNLPPLTPPPPLTRYVLFFNEIPVSMWTTKSIITIAQSLDTIILKSEINLVHLLKLHFLLITTGDFKLRKFAETKLLFSDFIIQ